MIEVDIPTGFRVDQQNLQENDLWGPYQIRKQGIFARQKVYTYIEYVSVVVYIQIYETFFFILVRTRWRKWGPLELF